MTSFLVALSCALILTGVSTLLLRRVGLIDIPNHRSSHVQPVPRGGGAAVVPSVAVALTVSMSWAWDLGVAVAGATALGLIGLMDDRLDIPAVRRLVAQVVLTAAIAAALVSQLDLSGAGVSVGAALLIAVWLTGFVNVYNFMDGANGVAALTALLAGLWFLLIGRAEDSLALTAGGAALAGASAGFLPWNFPRARVFMGDVGSYSVGCLVGCLTVLALVESGSITQALAPVSVLLCDSSVTLARRILRGEPAMTAHRDHAYQRLARNAGGSSAAAVAVSLATTLCIAASMLPLVACLVAWAIVLTAYMCLPRGLAKVRAHSPAT